MTVEPPLDLNSLPTAPGCYLYHDKDGTVIYVGKARNLKRRVSSYFQRHDLDPKTEALVSHIASIQFIVTNNEVEALILENNLIKRHWPKYNISLKDSKTYAYILRTEEEFPRFVVARDRDLPGVYFGPFTSAFERDYLLRALKHAFLIRSCRRPHKRGCLRYHMQSCLGPCIGAVSREEYAEQVNRAEAVLKGKGNDLIQALKGEMAARSEVQEFEQALIIRDQVQAIERLQEHQRVQRQKNYDEDVINYLVVDGTVYLALFNIYRGTLSQKEEYVFPFHHGFLDEFLVQYYADHPVPKAVVVPHEVDGSIEAFLGVMKGQKVGVIVPQRGDLKNLLDLVKTNIETQFFGDRIKVEELRKALHLPRSPGVIECFDISHLSGTAMVGVMVQFRDGRPDKKNYRKFRIRTVEGIDDFRAIAEVVRRRYSRLKQEEGRMPDLIVVDGGKGQLHAAVDELASLDLKIPLIALAKREEEVYMPGLSLPVPLDRRSKASLFLQQIRDETHRSAITYNRTLRRKKVVP